MQLPFSIPDLNTSQKRSFLEYALCTSMGMEPDGDDFKAARDGAARLQQERQKRLFSAHKKYSAASVEMQPLIGAPAADDAKEAETSADSPKAQTEDEINITIEKPGISRLTSLATNFSAYDITASSIKGSKLTPSQLLMFQDFSAVMQRWERAHFSLSVSNVCAV